LKIPKNYWKFVQFLKFLNFENFLASDIFSAFLNFLKILANSDRNFLQPAKNFQKFYEYLGIFKSIQEFYKFWGVFRNFWNFHKTQFLIPLFHFFFSHLQFWRRSTMTARPFPPSWLITYWKCCVPRRHNRNRCFPLDLQEHHQTLLSF
jgi:hypothetical protein